MKYNQKLNESTEIRLPVIKKFYAQKLSKMARKKVKAEQKSSKVQQTIWQEVIQTDREGRNLHSIKILF